MIAFLATLFENVFKPNALSLTAYITIGSVYFLRQQFKSVVKKISNIKDKETEISEGFSSSSSSKKAQVQPSCATSE